MNKVILTGNLGADPEKTVTQSGISRAAFSLAVQRDFVNQNGERGTDWVSCVAWKGTADLIEKYCNKGSKVLVEGAIRTRTYKAQDGSNRKAVEINVDRVEFLGKRGEAAQTTPEAQPTEFAEVDDDELPF